MRQSRRLFSILLLVGLGLGLSSGCAVTQPRGQGLYQYVKEPMYGAGYHLYLPVDYVKNNGRHPNPKMKKWPLVMTFHGMKPYDNALPQEREWEKEADFYGYIVCAPELRTSDSFMEYPLTREHSYVLDDRRNVLAIMDHVFATTLADRKKVLSTSWSCGGYLAHYFPNRFPERFSCIATRLSNFSHQLLIEETVPRYRDRVDVAIFIGDGDFPKCKSESEDAVAWYTARGFRVRGRVIDNMGHHRIPQTAAAFFAESLGLEPIYPVEAAATIAQVRMTEYLPSQDMIARLAPPIAPAIASARPTGSPRDLPPRSTPVTGSSQIARGGAGASPRRPSTPATVPPTAAPARPTLSYVNTTAGREYPANASPTYDPMPRTRDAQPDTTPTQLASAANPRDGQLDSTANPLPVASSTDAKPDTASNQPAPAAEPTKSRPASETSSRRSAGPAKAQPKESPARTATAEPRESQRSQPLKTEQRPAEKPAALTDASRGRSTPSPDTAAPPSETTPAASDATVAQPSRPFTPSDAGRQYGPVSAGVVPASAANAAATRKSSEKTPGASSRSGVRTTPNPDRTADRRPTDRVRRVNIKLGGPAIGTTPHYLRYEVDLPREVIAGSDFLWMDNGVWIGDEPRGVKILETPGLHLITVLVVTADNLEYRGSAKVHVLDRGPTAAAAN